MAQGAAMMAGGGQMPPQGQPQPQGGMPPIQATPGQVSGGDPQKIKAALEAAIKQSVNQQGYVDMNKLVQMWPSVSQQFGLNIPFQTVMQMIQQDPSLVEDIINQLGLAGIIVNGKMISAAELLQQAQGGGGGASAAQGTPPQDGSPMPGQPSPGNQSVQQGA